MGWQVKNPPTNAGDVEMQVQSLLEDALEGGKRTTLFAWKIPWTDTLQVAIVHALQRVGHD